MLTRRKLLTLLFKLTLSLTTTVAAVVAVFFALELHPDLVPHLGLERINYFAQRYRYVAHPTLVMEPRVRVETNSFPLMGDLWVPEAELHETNMYVTSYTAKGFRPDSSTPPHQAMLLGDSFIEFGESDETTLSEILTRKFDISCSNFGRHWYCPEQYNQLFRMHADTAKPTVAVYCLFMGNDLKDIASYQDWLDGEEYYHFRLDRRNALQRAKIAFWDLRWYVKHRLPTPPQTTLRDDVANLQLDDGRRWMRFAYWPDRQNPDAYRKSEEWLRFQTLLAEFDSDCDALSIRPLVMLIPAKSSIYLPLAIEAGSQAKPYLDMRPEQLLHAHTMVKDLCHELDIPVLDLAVPFTQQASSKLLYYPWDTHWTLAGRTLAAEELATLLRSLPEADLKQGLRQDRSNKPNAAKSEDDSVYNPSI